MKKKISVFINKRIKKFNKKINVPPDKSLSIRALLLASQCIGVSKIKNLLVSDDVLNCIKALRKLGVKIINKKNIYYIYGNGLNSFKSKNKLTKIFLGNSGTSARLILGLMSTHPGKFYLYGDESLNKRDMSRIIEPLEKIGCYFYPKGKKTLPITIEGTSMPLAQKHFEEKGSAQIKSALLLASLSTPGITTIHEKKISRNHSEIFLKNINSDIKIKKLNNGNLIKLRGQKNLYAFDYKVSSDPSSAAFLIALALLTPNSKLLIKEILCNPTRIGFIKILKEKMNARITLKNLKKKYGETVGDVFVQSSSLKPINCPKKLVPSVIDEFPILFIISSIIKGVSNFAGINELRHKESDRIKNIELGLNKMGIKTISTADSLKIFGNPNINRKKSIEIYPKNDHRIAMSWAIFALINGIKIKINNFETVDTSFPGFVALIKKIGGKIETN